MSTLTYAIDTTALESRLAARTIQLSLDDETTAFVAAERERRHSRLRWAGRAVARSMMSAFSANAIFVTYPLFLLSRAQWQRVLDGHCGGHLLDVGAAAGDVTSRLAELFDDITATDVSRPMVRRLAARGLRSRVLDLADGPAPDGPYEAVALLNVLDRCAQPRAVLAGAIGSLAPDGTLIVSMPLPYDPCWYDGPRNRQPVQRLGVSGAGWETGVGDLARTLEEHGLVVQVLTRAPYLSGGDRHQPIYVLDAAVLVARNEKC